MTRQQDRRLEKTRRYGRKIRKEGKRICCYNLLFCTM